jgi:dTDP-4-amino-4,6-dideoxygalactose transaminase
MVTWVPKKHINYESIQRLLKDSEESNQFTNGGPTVKKLESAVKTVLEIDESKSVICVSNGTHALYALVAAFELYESKDLKFTTQSFTFPASAQGYLNQVDIVDIDKHGGLDLNLVKDTDGIIVTNVFGNVVDIDKYVNWANQNHKYLIFDNAATSFTKYKGSNACNYGHASIISFHHTKPIGFGEGGCIIVDSKYESYVRRIINFGFDKVPVPVWHKLGSNYKMSDIQAAFILEYLSNFDTIVNTHKCLTNYFYSNIDLQTFPNYSQETPFLSCFCVFIENSADKLQDLLSQGIFARKYYIPLIDSPVATQFYSNIICIPCTKDMSYSDIDKIIDILK